MLQLASWPQARLQLPVLPGLNRESQMVNITLRFKTLLGRDHHWCISRNIGRQTQIQEISKSTAVTAGQDCGQLWENLLPLMLC